MKRRILVVDDDKTNLRITQLNLSQYGYDVFVAVTGMEAINLLRQEEVDLILIDIEMPIMNGMKTLEMIRKKPGMSRIPVVFLTASADSETVIEACRLEAADYVVKPYIPRDLYNRIEKILG